MSVFDPTPLVRRAIRQGMTIQRKRVDGFRKKRQWVLSAAAWLAYESNRRRAMRLYGMKFKVVPQRKEEK